MKENYPVYVKWLSVLDWILDKTEKIPKSARFSLSGRIANLSIDVMEGIIDAIYSRDKVYILDRLNIYIEKLRVLFRICYNRRYIGINQYEFIAGELNETGKMIGGWRKSLK